MKNNLLKNISNNPLIFLFLVILIGLLYLKYANNKLKEKFGVIIGGVRENKETDKLESIDIPPEETSTILSVSRLEGSATKKVKIGTKNDDGASWFCLMKVDNSGRGANFSALIKTFPTSINSYQEFAISFSNGRQLNSPSNKVYRIDKSAAGSNAGVPIVNYDYIALRKTVFDNKNLIEVWIHRTDMTYGTLGGLATIIFKQNRTDVEQIPEEDPKIFSYSEAKNVQTDEFLPEDMGLLSQIVGQDAVISEIKVDSVMQDKINRLNKELQEQEQLSVKTNNEAIYYQNTLDELTTQVNIQKMQADELAEFNIKLKEENRNLEIAIQDAEARILENSNSRDYNTNLKELSNLNIELNKLKAVKELVDNRTRSIIKLEQLSEQAIDILKNVNSTNEGMADYDAFGAETAIEGFSECGNLLSAKLNDLQSLRDKLIAAKAQVMYNPGGQYHTYISQNKTDNLIKRINNVLALKAGNIDPANIDLNASNSFLTNLTDIEISEKSNLDALKGFINTANTLKIGGAKEVRQARALLRKAKRIQTFKDQITKDGLNEVIQQTSEGLNPLLKRCNIYPINLEVEKNRVKNIKSDSEINLYMDVAQNSPEYRSLKTAIQSYGDNASANILSNGRLVFSVKFLRDVLGGASRAQQRVQNRSKWTPQDSKNIQDEINKIKATLGDNIVKTALGS